MPEIPVFDYDAVLAAVSPLDAIERVRDAFVRHRSGEWVMPAKVYLDAPDGPGDFRAMPARGGGLAILKWVTSFPGNSARGLPMVMGLVCVSDAGDGRRAYRSRQADDGRDDGARAHPQASALRLQNHAIRR